MAKPYISLKTRSKIAERADNRCEYCQSRADCACESFEGEHILPVSKGGATDLGNLAYTCRGCNSRKSDRTEALDPLRKQPAALFNPRTEVWSEHFAWSDDFLHIIGLSPTGRATVEALQLNRNGVVKLRSLMILGGIHPPLLIQEV